MTETYVPGFPNPFRVVPSRPNYAISEQGEVLSIRTNAVLVPKAGSFVVQERVERPGHLRTSEIDVRVFMAEVWPEVDFAPLHKDPLLTLWATALRATDGDTAKAKELLGAAYDEFEANKTDEI
jgi:hypothetical protein